MKPKRERDFDAREWERIKSLYSPAERVRNDEFEEKDRAA